MHLPHNLSKTGLAQRNKFSGFLSRMSEKLRVSYNRLSSYTLICYNPFIIIEIGL